MSQSARHDAWQAGENYDRYMGRWSRRLAPLFLDWLALRPGLDWLEVGCGTGALSAAILARCAPRHLLAVDPSEGLLSRARASIADGRADFRLGDAGALPTGPETHDVAVAALVLNFVPDPTRALAEMRRVTRPGGTVAFCVWDYPGGGIAFMRAFWQAAVALDPSAIDLTEDRRFPFCNRASLAALARDAGLAETASEAITFDTVFRDFDDYWVPFTLGAGPAPGYCASLAPEDRERLKNRLEASLPRAADGSIPLGARAWAVRGTVP